MSIDRTQSNKGDTIEHPEDHDFDQRGDGPEDAANIATASGPARRDTEDAGGATEAETEAPPERPNLEKVKSVSMPQVDTGAAKTTTFSEPFSAAPRRSTQINLQDAPSPPRRSTQMSRSGAARPSRDFDRRVDGPFGRPSITMTRRRSSQWSMPAAMPVQSPAQAVEDGKEGEARSDEPPPSMETFQSTDPAFEPEPPPLNYTLRTRYRSIFIFWSLILIDSIAMPLGLYFGLWYGTNLSPNTVFSIVTAALGGISIVEYVVRFWRLWKHSSTCRVIGARRAYLDWFHWNFSFAWFVVMVELIVGTVFKNPPIRLLSMPLTSMLYAFGTELLVVDILRYFQVPAPVRISSIPKGAQLRPCIYSIIEDVVAVDGSGGTKFREDLNRRYEASHVFRAMLRRLGVFWAVGAEGMAVVCTILIFTVSKDAAYSIGWSVPFAWAGIWTWATIWYVKRMLKKEKLAWTEEVRAKSNS